MQVISARHKNKKCLIIKKMVHSRVYLPVTFQTVGLGRLVHNQTRFGSQQFLLLLYQQ